MSRVLKHLLLPFTASLWYFICHYIVFGVFAGLVYVFTINLIYFIFLYLVFIGIISAIFTLPSIANSYLLDKLYNFSWLSVILHCLAGLFGIFSYLKILYSSDSTSLSVFWSISWLKTLLLALPAFGLIIGMIYSIGISPFLIKIDKLNER